MPNKSSLKVGFLGSYFTSICGPIWGFCETFLLLDLLNSEF